MTIQVNQIIQNFYTLIKFKMIFRDPQIIFQAKIILLSLAKEIMPFAINFDLVLQIDIELIDIGFQLIVFSKSNKILVSICER